MKKVVLYGAGTVLVLVAIRAMLANVPAEWRDRSNVFVMILLSAVFLAFVVRAYRKGKFN